MYRHTCITKFSVAIHLRQITCKKKLQIISVAFCEINQEVIRGAKIVPIMLNTIWSCWFLSYQCNYGK